MKLRDRLVDYYAGAFSCDPPPVLLEVASKVEALDRLADYLEEEARLMHVMATDDEFGERGKAHCYGLHDGLSDAAKKIRAVLEDKWPAQAKR